MNFIYFLAFPDRHFGVFLDRLFREDGINWDALYLKLIDISISSIRKTHKNSKIIVITNEPKRFDIDYDIDHVIDIKWKGDINKELRAATLFGWKSYINSDLFDNKSVFFDPDIIVQNSLEKVFPIDCDIGVCYRGGTFEPFVGCTITASPTPEAKRFFNRLYKIARELPEAKQRWGGGQEAMRMLVLGGYRHPDEQDVMVTDGIRVKLLDGNDWGYSEPYCILFRRTRFIRRLNLYVYRDHCRVYHFKGSRKIKNMEKHWNIMNSNSIIRIFFKIFTRLRKKLLQVFESIFQIFIRILILMRVTRLFRL